MSFSPAWPPLGGADRTVATDRDVATRTAGAERSVIDGTNYGGADVSVVATEYFGGSRSGVVLEEFQFGGTTVAADLHTMLWNADRARIENGRDDAIRGNLVGGNSDAPEETFQNDLSFGKAGDDRTSYTAFVGQDAVVGHDHPAVLVRTDLNFRIGYTDYDLDERHTAYTVLNPELGGQGDEARRTREDGYDLVVATGPDRQRYVAMGQRRPATGATSFDGARVGIEGRTSGADRSAWNDVYQEADGWITANDDAAGDVDAGVGLYLGRAREATWLTAVGMGTSADEVATAATAVLDAGYDGVLANYTS